MTDKQVKSLESVKEVKAKTETSYTLDIVKLIEKNPITRLSKEYQNNLINKIKSKFNESQQQIFVSSFYCYLNHNGKSEFIIDLDNVWKWLGFSRKDPAKVVLNKNFILDIDYKIVFQQPLENLKGGRPQEQILMTVNTFKKLCLKAGTKKADEIHEYYIALEELLQETINEETEELRKQLMLKNKIIEKNEFNKKMERHNLLIKKLSGKRCVYIVEIEENKYIKVGSSKDVDGRIKQLRRDYKNTNIIFLDVFECQHFREIEESILQDEKIRENLYKNDIAGNISKEIVKLTDDFTYKILLDIVEKYVKANVNLFTPDQLLEKQKLELEEKKLEFDLFNNLINSDKYSKTIEQILKDKLPDIVDKIKFEKKEEINNSNSNSNPNPDQNSIPATDSLVINPKTRETQINNYKLSLDTVIKGRKPKGRKLIKIDPNNFKNIIKVYDSMVFLLRDLDNKGFQKSSIQKSIKNNNIYKGYRWMFLEDGQNPEDCIIPETVKNKQPIISTILELNNTKTEILNSFGTKDITAKSLGIAKLRMKKIIKDGEKYGDKYYIEINKCPQNLLNNYKKPINRIIPNNAKFIKQINPITKEVVIFNTLSEISIRFGYASTTIKEAIQNKQTYGGFLWEYYENNNNVDETDTKT
jgi:hypothetical protein